MSAKQSQKEAVFTAVSNVLKQNGTPVVEGQAVSMSKELRAQVNSILFESFRNGTIEIDKEEISDSDLKGYVSGLQSNWLRKDKRLNGGTQYVAKNPGSRAGSGDPQLKAMRALMGSLTTDAEKAEVQGYIDARVADIQKSKIKSTPIDFSALPAGLAEKFAK